MGAGSCFATNQILSAKDVRPCGRQIRAELQCRPVDRVSQITVSDANACGSLKARDVYRTRVCNPRREQRYLDIRVTVIGKSGSTPSDANMDEHCDGC